MRYICSILLLLSFSIAMAQNSTNTYEASWKKADAYINKAQPASAQKIVNELFAKAKTENNAEQKIKCVCYLDNLDINQEETAIANKLKPFLDLYTIEKMPYKNIVASIIAQKYNAIYNQNRYEIRNRTDISNAEPNEENIKDWTAANYENTIEKYFSASLENKKEIAVLPIEKFNYLLVKGTANNKFRPTLFDFLTHQALEFYTNNRNQMHQAAAQFSINDAKAFGTINEFLTWDLAKEKNTSNVLKSLQLYQSLLQQSIANNNADALMHNNLMRLNFAYANCNLSNKNSLYQSALRGILKENLNTAGAQYALAENIIDEDRNNPEKNIDITEAKKICDDIIENSKNIFYVNLAKNLISELERKTIDLTTEKNWIPNEPALALVNYKNISKLFIKVYAITLDDYKNAGGETAEKQILKTLNSSPVASYERDLIVKNDYKDIATEIILDKLPIGFYTIFASEKNTPNYKVDPICKTNICVTNLSILTYAENKNSVVYVLDRKTGMPISNVAITSSYEVYEYTKRTRETKIFKKNNSDSKGKITLEKSENNLDILATFQKDNLWQSDAINPFYDYQNNAGNTNPVNSYIYTDRAIYRPGQTVFYKALYFTKDKVDKKYSVLKSKKTELILRDANYQEIKKIECTTNEFGSCAGNFVIPSNLMNGEFSISDSDNGTVYFSVEEYKRPKFMVVLDTVKESFKLNSVVKIKGNAKSYSGANVQNAKVVYRVKRNAYFPYRWCFYQCGSPNVRETEITNGTASTNENGNFEIAFTALPDETLDAKSKPVFTYEIIADVTDNNGETKTGNTNINISNTALIVSIDAPSQIDLQTNCPIKISAKNLAGMPVESKVKVKVNKLKDNNIFYKERHWQKPKNQIISKAIFNATFPDIEYAEESDKNNWEILGTQTEYVISVSENSIDKDELKFSKPGWYKIEATTIDKFNDTIFVIEYVHVGNDNYTEPIVIENLKEVYKPTLTENGTFKSCFQNLYVVHLQDNQMPMAKEIIYAEKPYKFDFEISEKDKGGYFQHFMFVKNNRVYEKEIFINIPFLDKKLDIKTASFRDKVEPGSDQEYTITITGADKEKVQAELLASMYDASLDALKPHSWNKLENLYYNNSKKFRSNNYNSFTDVNSSEVYYIEQKLFDAVTPSFNTYNWVNQPNMYRQRMLMKSSLTRGNIEYAEAAAGVVTEAAKPVMAAPIQIADENSPRRLKVGADKPEEKTENKNSKPVTTRTNLQETAFFFPQFATDKDGNIVMKFKMPEALTKWRLMLLAHTQDAKTGFAEKELVTQKELMVTPTIPRFFRNGDNIQVATKINNLSTKNLAVQSSIQIIDASTNEIINAWVLDEVNKNLNINAGASAATIWNLKIPENYINPVIVKIIATADNYSDGEQVIIPVIPNSKLITETVPFFVTTGNNKSFTIPALLDTKNDAKPHALTVEYTANPAWYAVQSLPYLTNYPYDCAEQIFHKLYANVIAAHVANSNPSIAATYKTWLEKDTNALKSNLQKNEELKSVLLQETPWVAEAQSEEAQKREIANLFNTATLSATNNTLIDQLTAMQSSNGGFMWFKGSPDDVHITNVILTGIGRLQHLNIPFANVDDKIKNIIASGVKYLDARMQEQFENETSKAKNKKWNTDYNSPIAYIYMRSFYNNIKLNAKQQKIIDFYYAEIEKTWSTLTPYMKALYALSLHRMQKKTTLVNNIVKSLKETAGDNPELGMYWKQNAGFYWQEAPIEAQSVLIELMDEVAKDAQSVARMKLYLLKQKQTNRWSNTNATADACYALLLQGSNLVSNTANAKIELGNVIINTARTNKEAGTGYTKVRYDAKAIQANMGNVKIDVVGDKPNQPTWGAVYYQYFQQLNKITNANTDVKTPMKISKKLFKVSLNNTGEILTPITEKTPLQVGDKVRVRIVLEADRDMEFVHLHDMRSSNFEPTNVLSEYKYQDGMGYYESTKDASTNFFIGYLPKGTKVFEYTLTAFNRGICSNGIATIQCMYAPEFAAHSIGEKVEVK